MESEFVVQLFDAFPEPGMDELLQCDYAKSRGG